MNILDPEEYVEQAYLYRSLQVRLKINEPVQEMLKQIREEVLATTKLPMAIDFLLAEVRHVGTMSTAMEKMPHYFTQFQIFIVSQAENEKGRFDMRVAFAILESEANFRAQGTSRPAMFFFQMESLCRNALGYDDGLQSIATDPIYDVDWQHWILQVRHQLGLVELADLIYVHSDYYRTQQQRTGGQVPNPVLFGEKEGRIALANRKKEPHYMFAALQRQLGYPAVPVPQKRDPTEELVPKLARTVQRLEVRIKLLEEEQRQSGIDLSQFMRNDSNR